MKKFICLLVALGCVCGLSSCGCVARPEETIENIEIENQIIETTEIIETVVEETVMETIEEITVETEPSIQTEVEETKKLEVPHYFQQDYNVRYGCYGTVGTHGCGITCLAMALSAIKGKEILPDELALKYGKYNTVVGSSWNLFGAVCEDYEVECKQVFWPQLDEVYQALKDGKLVISNQRHSAFTKSGHYILLIGLSKDEERLFVLDPNKWNYTIPYLVERFEDGFKKIVVEQGSSAYWIIG